MSTQTFHWEHPRICATCTYFYRDTADPIQPGCPACHQADQLNNQSSIVNRQ